MRHEDYKNTLFNNNQMYHTMKTTEAAIVNLEAMSSIKCHYHALIINDTFMRMV